MNQRRVAITGLGLVSPYGGDLAGFFARLSAGDDLPLVDPFPDQDSARLWLLAQADALLMRPAHDPARKAGEKVQFLML